MKRKMKIFAVLAIVISGFGYSLSTPKNNERYNQGREPDQFDIYVDIYNVPVCTAYVTIQGDYVWVDEEAVSINGSGYGSFHTTHLTYTGTIIVTVEYYHETCWNWAQDIESGWFHWSGGPYYFETTSYSAGDCN